ncbi:MAG: hypothetical protein IKC34_03810 [Clostridia bacterium]|nr:hypothetical protein [Clostridia bacterium]
MNKFTVGLPIEPKPGFIDKIVEYKDRISEVYFSWGSFPGGRSAQTSTENAFPWEAEAKLIEALKYLSDEGLRFNLLFNANCYGAESLSRSLFMKIGDTVDYIASNFTLASVTTTSPIIAGFIKDNFDGVKTRASVNMEIGTVEGMDYLADKFDGYYMNREYNRNLEKIKELRAYCDKNGKELYMLANSGCLNYCSAHVFHDNLVAHEAEIAKYDNAYKFGGVCHSYLKGRIEEYLRITNFIRPEDLHLVADYFDGIKLATRVNPNPSRLLDAYMKGSYRGQVTSLLEPDHSGVFYPAIIENQSIDEHYTETVLSCNKRCAECGYCIETCKKAIIKLEEL